MGMSFGLIMNLAMCKLYYHFTEGFLNKILYLNQKTRERRHKWPVYIFTFGEINSWQVNVGGIQIFRAQFQSLKLRKEMLNAANIYLFGIKLTKCKYIDRSLAWGSFIAKSNFLSTTEGKCIKQKHDNLMDKFDWI